MYDIKEMLEIQVLLKKYKKKKILDLEALRELYENIVQYLKNCDEKKYEYLGDYIANAYEIHADEDKNKKYNMLIQVLNSYFKKDVTVNNVPKIKANNNINIREIKPKNTNDDLPCLSGYKIIKILGQGAFGKVYLVTKNNKEYAMKEQLIKIATTPDQQADYDYYINSIKNELKIGKILGKQKIGPRIYDTFMCKKTESINIYIVMQAMNKGTIQEFSKKNIISDVHLGQIRKKINKLHSLNILHRDLHAGNVLVNQKKNKEYEFYLGDFGLSEYISAGVARLKKDELNLWWLDQLPNGLNEIITKIMILMKVI